MRNQFNDKFAVDEVHEGGTGSYVFQADSVKDRFENSEERTKRELDGIHHRQKREYIERDHTQQLRKIIPQGNMLEDAVGMALFNGDYENAGAMLQSIRIYKHEEGNASCQHCV